jgi:hypothetical protein
MLQPKQTSDIAAPEQDLLSTMRKKRSRLYSDISPDPSTFRDLLRRAGCRRPRWQVPEATWDAHPEVLDRAKVILLKEERGRLTRVTGAVRIGPVEVTAKAFPSSRERSFAAGALYRPLLTAGHSQ